MPNDNSLLFKYMYISTYRDNNNTLVYKGKPMTIRKCKEYFGLSEKANRQAFNSLMDSGLLYMDNELIKVKQTDILNRIHNKGMRELYVNASYRDHKLLSQFILLMPCIDQHSNLAEISKWFNVAQSNSDRLRKKLSAIMVNNVPLLSYDENKKFVVNSFLFNS